MSDEWNEMTNRYDDQIKMLEAQMLDNDKKMLVMMLNEVKAILSAENYTLHETLLIKLEKKLFNDLLFAYNIDKKEMRITNGT